MPELPEVETIKETLKQCVLNQKIVDVQVHYEVDSKYGCPIVCKKTHWANL